MKLATGAAALAQAQGAAADRIDCQSHLFSEEFLSLLAKRKDSPYVVRQRADR